MAALSAAPVSGMTQQEVTSEKRRLFRNIIVVSVSFLLLFTAFRGLLRLQSSLHHNEGLGVLSQSVLYGTLVASCLFVPRCLVNALGHKWTMCVSMTGFIAWMAANGYPVWETMIPGSILTGLFAAPLWAAQGSYFAILAKRYASISKKDESAVLARFFGVFFFIFQLCNIIGSVISSTVLLPETINSTLEDHAHEMALQYCGANDCPDHTSVNSTINIEPPQSKA